MRCAYNNVVWKPEDNGAYLGDADVTESLIVNSNFEKQRENVEWIHLAQDRVQWRIFPRRLFNNAFSIETM
jgi:hypothetical protein